MAWLPLESNPDVMNKFLGTLGVPAKWQIVDVYGLEPDLLAMVPRPVVAVILLFPTSDKYEEHRSQQEAEIKEKGQTVSDKVYYLKQYVQNACGTIALIHSIANNTEMVQLCDGHLKQFLDDSGNLSPEEHGELLQKAEGIINVHKEIGREGQTEAPEPSEPVNYHFVAFVCKDGDLYELDGRKSFPVNHGTTSPDTLLEWRQFLKKIEERLRTMIASKEFMKSFIQGKSNSHCPNIAGSVIVWLPDSGGINNTDMLHW